MRHIFVPLLLVLVWQKSLARGLDPDAEDEETWEQTLHDLMGDVTNEQKESSDEDLRDLYASENNSELEDNNPDSTPESVLQNTEEIASLDLESIWLSVIDVNLYVLEQKAIISNLLSSYNKIFDKLNTIEKQITGMPKNVHFNPRFQEWDPNPEQLWYTNGGSYRRIAPLL